MPATRPTGTWTDALRVGWRRSVGTRAPLLDRTAHRAYSQWQRLFYATRLFSDLPSVARYLLVESRWAPAEPVPVRVRALGGAQVWLRPRTTDAVMLRDTFRDCVHPPPPEIAARGVHNIIDLGANAGITVAHNALLYPRARIVAVELDPDNAEAARRNTRPWADRCEIIQGAVWVADGEIPFAREQGREYGFRVVDAAADRTTRALSMATILGHVPADERVDYVKMDIEGVEARLLSDDAACWTDRIDSISLQVHDPYTLKQAARDLAKLGFRPRVEPRRMNYIVGVRH